jgi:hypothetical protein
MATCLPDRLVAGFCELTATPAHPVPVRRPSDELSGLAGRKSRARLKIGRFVLVGCLFDSSCERSGLSFAKTRSNRNFKKSDGGRSGLGEAGGLGCKGRAWNSSNARSHLKLMSLRFGSLEANELMASSAISPPQKGCSKRY